MRPSTLIIVSLLVVGGVFLFWRFDGQSVFRAAVRGPVSLAPVKAETSPAESKAAGQTEKNRKLPLLLPVSAGPAPAPPAVAPAQPPAAAPRPETASLTPGAGRKDVIESLGEPALMALKIDNHELEEQYWYRPSGPHPLKITLREGRVTDIRPRP
jgi:hypothetical protein